MKCLWAQHTTLLCSPLTSPWILNEHNSACMVIYAPQYWRVPFVTPHSLQQERRLPKPNDNDSERFWYFFASNRLSTQSIISVDKLVITLAPQTIVFCYPWWNNIGKINYKGKTWTSIHLHVLKVQWCLNRTSYCNNSFFSGRKFRFAYSYIPQTRRVAGFLDRTYYVKTSRKYVVGRRNSASRGLGLAYYWYTTVIITPVFDREKQCCATQMRTTPVLRKFVFPVFYSGSTSKKQ